jgi:hypothetical protein
MTQLQAQQGQQKMQLERQKHQVGC